MLSTGSALFEPWPSAKFRSFFLQESRRKRAGLPPALPLPCNKSGRSLWVAAALGSLWLWCCDAAGFIPWEHLELQEVEAEAEEGLFADQGWRRAELQEAEAAGEAEVFLCPVPVT